MSHYLLKLFSIMYFWNCRMLTNHKILENLKKKFYFLWLRNFSLGAQNSEILCFVKFKVRFILFKNINCELMKIVWKKKFFFSWSESQLFFKNYFYLLFLFQIHSPEWTIQSEACQKPQPPLNGKFIFNLVNNFLFAIRFIDM